jgi:hypothetical protein
MLAGQNHLCMHCNKQAPHMSAVQQHPELSCRLLPAAAPLSLMRVIALLL